MAKSVFRRCLLALCIVLIYASPSDAGWRMYVVNWIVDDISVFDQHGNYLYSFAADPPTSMRQLQIAPNGSTYVASLDRHRIIEFDDQDRHVAEFGYLENVHGLAVGPSNQIYISNKAGEGRIYASDGSLVGSFDFGGPSLTVAQSGHLIAVDSLPNNQIYIADLDGNLQRVFSAGSGTEPRGVAVGPDGLIYVARAEVDDIAVFDFQGNLRRVISGHGIDYPLGLQFSPEGHLAVANLGAQNVLVLTTDGDLVTVVDHDIANPIHVAFRVLDACNDFDGDGYGTPGDDSCPAGDLNDCDDTRTDVFPDAPELYDARDNDCDGFVDEGLDDDADGVPNFYDVCAGTPTGSGVGPDGCAACVVDPDDDGDGYPASVDCDDSNATVHPAATESCNNEDDDCDTEIDEGFDGDLDGYTVCAVPTPDCDDSDATISPMAVELLGNAVDENCDGSLGACDPNALWSNHGQYVRCVADEVEGLVVAGAISQQDGDSLISAAAQSEVGK